MKCYYRAIAIKHDNTKHNIENSFEIDMSKEELLSDYIIRCHALVDNFPLGDATGTDNVTILDWTLNS
jgi:hypothetical protein